jgi:hypothetical protein
LPSGSCSSQQGCTEACTGIATSCDQVSTTECSEQPGCSLQ